MPAQIDWKAEDEKEWGVVEPEHLPSTGGRHPGWRLRHVLLALVAAAGLAALIFSHLGRFLEDSSNKTEAELLSAHALAMDAATGGDGDLLRQLVLDRLPDWTDAEVLLAESGLWLDRAPLGLHLSGDNGPPATQVELDPDLNQAVVAVTVGYGLDAGGATQEIVHLQQIFTYYHEEERWLLSPPTAAFWGTRLTSGGSYLALSYPERDAEIGIRLAADLEAVLNQACHVVEMLNCDPSMRMAVDLVADPALLINLADPAWLLLGGRNIQLPAPSVIGLPADEAAYRALYRAYARLVVSRLIAEQTDLAGTEQPLLALSIVDVILQQLGLQPSIGSPALEDPHSVAVVEALDRIWSSDTPLADELAGPDRQIAWAVVESLVSSWSGVAETEMLRSLGQSANAQDWLGRLLTGASISSFAEAWDRAAAASGQLTAPPEWPGEVVLLMCEQGLIGSASLYRYDPAADNTRRLLSGREFIRMEPLPGGLGLLLTEQWLNKPEQQTYLWREGRLTPYEGSDAGSGTNGPSESQFVLAGPPGQNELRAISNDGRWLARLDAGLLVLSATGDSFVRSVPLAAKECRSLAWLQTTNPMEQK